MLLLITALAVLWVWEYLLLLSPVHIPVWLQPIIVVGLAVAAPYVPDHILMIGAVAGAVALFHRHLAGREGHVGMTRPRTRGLPPL